MALRRAAHAHLQTWRPYTLTYPGLVGLAGAVLSPGTHPGWRLLAAWAGPTLGWVSGHYLGDYFDRELDARSKPQRPIPSGRLSPRAAVAAGGLCAVGAVVVGEAANWRAVLLVVGALAGIVAYSRVLKARGLSGNLIRGVLTALALAFGSFATASVPPWYMGLFAAVFLCHDTASNLVGTLRDVHGDGRAGYATVPVRYGVRRAAWTSALWYVAAFLAAAGCAWAAPVDTRAYVPLLLFAAAIGSGAFVRLLVGDGPPSPVVAFRAHEILVGERLVLAGAVIAAGAGLVAAAAVTLPALAFSLLTQARMRSGYEFGPSGVAAPRAVRGGTTGAGSAS